MWRPEAMGASVRPMQSEASGPQEAATSKRLVRAGLMGLSGGLLLGGLALLALGLYTRMVPVDCLDLSDVQCGFTRDASVSMGRFQTLMGAGLLALGIAGILLLRPPKAPPPTA